MTVVSAAVLSACGTVGDTAAVRDANKLAIDCKTNQALLAVDRASRGGGLGANIADLQRVVILRDAGRTADADRAMAERNESAGADAEAVDKAERAVAESVAEMRRERQKQTGHRICP